MEIKNYFVDQSRLPIIIQPIMIDQSQVPTTAHQLQVAFLVP